MSANASRGDETSLLILPAKQRIFALNPVALTQAQATKREVEREYRDALLLDRDGTLRRIERIDILGPVGDTIAQRLWNRMNSGWRVAVQLSQPLPLNLAALRRQIAEYIRVNGGVNDAEDEPPPPSNEELAHAVLRAESVAELFETLRMPSADEALDVL